MSEERIKVRFKLERDDEGWPPVEGEGVWAEPLGDDRFRIDNTPWFVRGFATDDIVVARAGSDGQLWVAEKVEWSGRRTIRVIPLEAGRPSGALSEVLDVFEPFGVSGEGAVQWKIVALDVPAHADVVQIKRLLVVGEAEGRWEFEEGCVDQLWLDA